MTPEDATLIAALGQVYQIPLDERWTSLRNMPVWLIGVYARGPNEDVATGEPEAITDDALARIAAGQPL